jgi:hypothetical protein
MYDWHFYDMNNIITCLLSDKDADANTREISRRSATMVTRHVIHHTSSLIVFQSLISLARMRARKTERGGETARVWRHAGKYLCKDHVQSWIGSLIGRDHAPPLSLSLSLSLSVFLFSPFTCLPLKATRLAAITRAATSAAPFRSRSRSSRFLGDTDFERVIFVTQSSRMTLHRTQRRRATWRGVRHLWMRIKELASCEAIRRVNEERRDDRNDKCLTLRFRF